MGWVIVKQGDLILSAGRSLYKSVSLPVCPSVHEIHHVSVHPLIIYLLTPIISVMYLDLSIYPSIRSSNLLCT